MEDDSGASGASVARKKETKEVVVRVSEIPSLKPVQSQPIDVELLGAKAQGGLKRLDNGEIAVLLEEVNPNFQDKPLFVWDSHKTDSSRLVYYLNDDVFPYALKYDPVESNHPAKNTYGQAEANSENQGINGLVCVATGTYEDRRKLHETVSRAVLGKVAGAEEDDLSDVIRDVYFKSQGRREEIDSNHANSALVVHRAHRNNWAFPEIRYVKNAEGLDSHVTDTNDSDHRRFARTWKERAKTIESKFSNGEKITTEDIKDIELMSHLVDMPDLIDQIKEKLEQRSAPNTATEEESSGDPKTVEGVIKASGLNDQLLENMRKENTTLSAVGRRILLSIKDGTLDDDLIRKLSDKLDDIFLETDSENALLLLAVLSGIASLRNRKDSETSSGAANSAKKGASSPEQAASSPASPEGPKNPSEMSFREVASEIRLLLDNDTITEADKIRLELLRTAQIDLWNGPQMKNIRPETERLVRNALIESDWSNYEVNLKELARNMEDLNASSAPEYRDYDKGKLLGLVEAAVMGTLFEVRTRGLEHVRDKPTKLQELREDVATIDHDLREIPYRKLIDFSPTTPDDFVRQSPKPEKPPETEAEVLKNARQELNRIENLDTDPHENAREVGAIADLIQYSERFPSVAKEVKLRLSLADCFMLIKSSNGFIARPSSGGAFLRTIGDAASIASSNRHHFIGEELINAFFKSEFNGIPTASAWDALQRTRINYQQYAQRSGNVVGPDETSVNYIVDPSPTRKDAVRRVLMAEIAGPNPTQESLNNAKTALQLAEFMVTATLERSIFNESLSGNDELAELIYFKKFREKRSRDSRDSGPSIHLSKIPGFGTSFLRRSLNILDPRTPMRSADIVAKQNSQKPIQDGAWEGHLTVAIGKAHALKGLLLDEKPDPSKAPDVITLKSYVDYFNKADPNGTPTNNRLRKMWVLGYVESAKNPDLGWETKDLYKLKDAMTKKKINDVTMETFLTEAEWRDIVNQTHVVDYLEMNKRNKAFKKPFGR